VKYDCIASGFAVKRRQFCFLGQLSPVQRDMSMRPYISCIIKFFNSTVSGIWTWLFGSIEKACVKLVSGCVGK